MRLPTVLFLLAASPAALAQSLSVTGSCPGVMFVEGSGYTPGESIAILTGRGLGSDVMPGGPCAGGATDLSGLSYVTTVRADGGGNVAASPSISAGLCGSYVQFLDATTCSLSNTQRFGGSGEYVLFTTDTVINGGSSLANRAEADAYCGEYAVANGIAGSDFRIVYSTPSEDAADFITYSEGDTVYDRTGALVTDTSLWAGGIVLSDLVSWTITGTWNGAYYECDGGYEPGSWPICQYCDQKFSCASSSDNPFEPSACCWTGDRAVVCMGEL